MVTLFVYVSVSEFFELFLLFFFFNDTATTEIYTLSLHDALPIYRRHHRLLLGARHRRDEEPERDRHQHEQDRKSTRLNSSHSQISYAVFCLKKKKIQKLTLQITNFSFIVCVINHFPIFYA